MHLIWRAPPVCIGTRRQSVPDVGIRLISGQPSRYEAAEFITTTGLGRPRACKVLDSDTVKNGVVVVGQDISERILQMATTPPQFSMGKSYPGFGPVGPWLVTPDELATPTTWSSAARSTASRCRRAGPGSCSSAVPELIEQLSAVTPLLPGDIIFTGTPSGVGMGRSPQRWLAPGDVLDHLYRGHRRDAAHLRGRVIRV